MAFAEAAPVAAYNDFTGVEEKLLRLSIVLLAIELDLSSQIGVESDVLDGGLRFAMADTDACDDLVFWHLQTALELLTRARSKPSRVHPVFEVQLDGANGVVNAASDPVQEPLGQLEGLPLGHTLVQVGRVAELKLASVHAAERKLAKCATLVLVRALAVVTGGLD